MIKNSGTSVANLTNEDLVQNKLGGLQSQINALQQQQTAATSVTVELPEPDTAFTTVYERTKRGVFATLKYFIPVMTQNLKTYLIKHSDRIVSQAVYDKKQIKDDSDDITDAERAAGTIERRFDIRLDYDTQYDMARLVAVGEGSLDKRKNPPDDPLYTDTPLHTFTTPEAFGVPSSPNASLILINKLDESTKDYDAYVVLRQYAPLNLETGAAQSYRVAQVDTVKSHLSRTGTTETAHNTHLLSEAELDQVDAGSTPANRGYCDLTIRSLRPGVPWTWDRNVNYTNGEKKESTGSPVSFTAGGLQIGTAGIPELQSFSVTATVDGDIAAPTGAVVTVTFQQHATTAVALRRIELYVKKSTTGSYPDDPQYLIPIHKDSYHTPNATYNVVFDHVKIKPRKDWNIKAIIVGEAPASGVHPTRTATVTLDATALNDPATPAAGQIISNILDPSTKAHDSLVTFRVIAPLNDAGGAQDMATAQVEKAWVQVQRTSTGNKRKAGGALNSTELTQVDAGSSPANRGYVDIEVPMKVAPYTWIANIIEGMGETHYATASIAFNAGGLATAVAGITELTSVSLSLNTSDPYSGRNGLLSLNFTQPSTPVALRYAILERSIDAGANYVTVGDPISLKDELWHTAGAKIVPLRQVTTKPSTSHIFRVTITAQGGSTRAISATVSTGGVIEVLDDTAVPSSLTTPTLTWDDRGGLMVRNIGAGAQTKTIFKGELVIYNNAGLYYDFTNKTGSASEQKLEISPKGHKLVEVKRKTLRAIFGTASPQNIYAYYYLTNSQGTSSASSNSTALDLFAMQDYLSATNAVDVLDVGTQLNSPGQMLANGDFGYAQSGTTLKKWHKYRSVDGTPILANDTTITTATTGTIFWDQTNHNAVWEDEAYRLIQDFDKRLVPGDYFSLSFLAKTTTPFTATVSVIFRNNSTGADETEAALSIVMALTTSYQTFGGTMRLATTADASVQHVLSFETATNISTSNDVIIDRTMMVRGKAPMSFTPRPEQYELGATGTEDFDVTPASIGVSPDTGNPTGGTQGGWNPAGGVFTPST